MKLSKKRIVRDGVKYMAVYRGNEFLVILPEDDTSAEVFRTYQKIEDEREERAEANSDEEKDLDSFTAEFKRRFREEWPEITARLLEKYPDRIKRIRFVPKK